MSFTLPNTEYLGDETGTEQPGTPDNLSDNGNGLTEKLDEGIGKFIEEASSWNFADVPLETSGAFLYALLDGYSFGVVDALLRMALGDDAEKALDGFIDRNGTALLAGNVASFLSPQGAVRLWSTVGRLGLRSLQAAGKGAKKLTKASAETFIKRSERKMAEARAGARGSAEQLEELAQADDYYLRLFRRLGLDPREAEELQKIAYHGTDDAAEISARITRMSDEVNGLSGKMAEIAATAQKAAAKGSAASKFIDTAIKAGDRGAQSLLEVLARFGIEPIDIYQVAVIYKNVKDYELGHGESEEYASEVALKMAATLLVGKLGRGFFEYLSSAVGIGKSAPSFWRTLLRVPIEMSAGLLIVKGGDFQEAAGAAEGIANTLVEAGTAALQRQNTGGLIAPVHKPRPSPRLSLIARRVR